METFSIVSTPKFVKFRTKILILFKEDDGSVLNLLGNVMEETHIFRFGWLKFKLVGIFILKLLFEFWNEDRDNELLQTLTFDTLGLSMALNFNFAIDATPGRIGKFSNLSLVRRIEISLILSDFIRKYCNDFNVVYK